MRVAFAYTDGDGNANSDGNGVSISNAYANCNTWRQNYPDTAAASNSGTSAVSLGAYLQISSGTREAFASPRKAASSLSQSASSQR